MYEELIDDLRTLARICKLTNHEHTSTHRLAVQAADAIEELSKRVPYVPHGDLIDRDALLASDPDLHAVKENKFGAEYMIDIYSGANKSGYSACMIEEAPTVIPADTAEEDE